MIVDRKPTTFALMTAVRQTMTFVTTTAATTPTVNLLSLVLKAAMNNFRATIVLKRTTVV